MKTNNNENNTAMSAKPPHRGGGLEGVSIKNREAFFDCLEEGLQSYFDGNDRFFGGIIHLTVGVRDGQVGGIIKSEAMLHYSGFTLDRVREILRYVLPRHLPRTDVALAVDDIINELRMGRDEPEPPKHKGGRPKKQNTKQSTLNTKQANTETHEQEETEGQPR
jgi:hypothetical protein